MFLLLTIWRGSKGSKGEGFERFERFERFEGFYPQNYWLNSLTSF